MSGQAAVTFRVTYASHDELRDDVSQQMVRGGLLVKVDQAADLQLDTPVSLELVLPDGGSLRGDARVLQVLAGFGVAVSVGRELMEQASRAASAPKGGSASERPARGAVRHERIAHGTPSGLPATVLRPAGGQAPGGPQSPPTPSDPVELSQVVRARSDSHDPVRAARTRSDSHVGTPRFARATRDSLAPDGQAAPAGGPRAARTRSDSLDDRLQRVNDRAQLGPSAAGDGASRAHAPAAPPRVSRMTPSAPLRFGESPLAERARATPSIGDYPTSGEPPSDVARAARTAAERAGGERAGGERAGGERAGGERAGGERAGGEPPTRTEKIHKALHGSRDERNAILRDRDRTLHPFVLKNPQLDADDVVAIAKNAQVAPDLLKLIAARKDWFQRPAIALGLARNPKTPPEIAVRALEFIPVEALRQIAKGVGALPHVVQAARKKLVG